MPQATTEARLATAIELANQAHANGDISEELLEAFLAQVDPQPNTVPVLIHLEVALPDGAVLPAVGVLNTQVAQALSALASRVGGTVSPESVSVITA